MSIPGCIGICGMGFFSLMSMCVDGGLSHRRADEETYHEHQKAVEHYTYSDAGEDSCARIGCVLHRRRNGHGAVDGVGVVDDDGVAAAVVVVVLVNDGVADEYSVRLTDHAGVLLF